MIMTIAPSLEEHTLDEQLQALEEVESEEMLEVEILEENKRESEHGFNGDIQEIEQDIGEVTSSTPTLTLEQVHNKVIKKLMPIVRN